MQPAAQQIDQLTGQVASYVTGWRHWLHRHPEPPNREAHTAAYVARHLRALKLDEVRTGVAGHGVVGVLRGGRRGDRVMALRAGIDALPDGPFTVAHACGHDCDTAMLMGSAAVLAQVRDDLPGTVLFVFQPAEEGPPPDEPGGAALVEAEGALCDPVPTMVYGHHVAPLPVGYVGYRTGNQYGAACLLKIVVTGEPTDPMPAAARIICAMGELYRRTGAFDPVTISIGHLEDAGRFNIIGDHVTLWGTIRCMAEPDMPKVQRVVARAAGNMARAYGCSARTEFRQDVPAVHNDPAWVDAALPTLRAVAGPDRVVRTQAVLGYDDVSVLVNKYGGLYVLLGCQDGVYAEDGELRPVPGGRGLVANHRPAFYADDSVLATGVRLHARLAVGHLSGAVVA